MSFESKSLNCSDCGSEFMFSAGEQSFFASRGLRNEPKRCPSCRLVVRFSRTGRDPATLSDVNCAECGAITRVPFKPKGYRPVLCNGCLATKKTTIDSEVALAPQTLANSAV
jgi:CxxC-x17-CxxC domain-containing protein